MVRFVERVLLGVSHVREGVMTISIFAKEIRGASPIPGGLTLVELPPNCSIDGSVSEMRGMLLELVEFVRGPFLNIEQESRLREIEKWLHG